MNCLWVLASQVILFWCRLGCKFGCRVELFWVTPVKGSGAFACWQGKPSKEGLCCGEVGLGRRSTCSVSLLYKTLRKILKYSLMLCGKGILWGMSRGGWEGSFWAMLCVSKTENSGNWVFCLLFIHLSSHSTSIILFTNLLRAGDTETGQYSCCPEWTKV